MFTNLSSSLGGLLKSFCRAGLWVAIVAIAILPCKSSDNLSAVGTVPAKAGLSPTDAQADFDFMREALEEAHPGMYRFSTKTKLDREFAAQREKLSRPVTKREFFEVMAETLSLIKCGHTSIKPDDEMGKAFGNARLFPLQVMVEGWRFAGQIERNTQTTRRSSQAWKSSRLTDTKRRTFSRTSAGSILPMEILRRSNGFISNEALRCTTGF
jgi:hypothetical protein